MALFLPRIEEQTSLIASGGFMNIDPSAGAPIALFIAGAALTFCAGTLLRAGWQDYQSRIISNPTILLGLGTIIIFWLASVFAHFTTISFIFSAFLVSLCLFLACLFLFSRGLIGGGDAKLISSMALLAGPDLSASFLFITALAGGFLSLAYLFYFKLLAKQVFASPIKADNQTPSLAIIALPYGLAIMIGGLYLCFMRFSALPIIRLFEGAPQ